MHRLVIEGVITIVYAIIVCTYTAFSAHHMDKIGEEQQNENSSRTHIKVYTHTSYFNTLNQIATFKVAISYNYECYFRLASMYV